MLFRAVIYSTDHSINIIYPAQKGNWFAFRGRSYRKDRNAVCQVINKNNTIKGTVEALYVEGYPLPRRSTLDVLDVTREHLRELLSEATNKPQKSFWDALLRR
jgi:hypothetical protein